jgi:cardiolipin synthase A/B
VHDSDKFHKSSVAGYNTSMNYKFYSNSEKAWEAMFEAMQNAKESIYLQMYIFQNDMEEFNFFNLLRDKARQGARVRLILDSFGSINLDNGSILKLKDVGVEILSHSYLLNRMHKKILVVDERIAFVGGVNFHQIARLWNDLVIRMSGKGLVKKVALSFARSYARAGGKDPLLLGKNGRTSRTQVRIGIIENSPSIRNFHLKRIYKAYLRNAQKSILIMTPYFIPKRWIRSALHRAVRRGVSVEVLIPRTTDHFIVDRVNYFYIYKLSQLGVKFYIQENMNHAKAVIVDGKEAMVGSQNMDFLSFDFNSEAGIFFKDAQMVSKLSEIAEEWKRTAILFDPKTNKPKWFDHVLSPIINLGSIFYRIFMD